MRFREGMRRVALAVGAVGFFIGSWIAVIVPFDMISNTWKRQREFNSAIGLPLVQTVLASVSKQGLRGATVHIDSTEVNLLTIGNRGEVLSVGKSDGSTLFKPQRLRFGYTPRSYSCRFVGSPFRGP
jgi:hypothetical protein